jgi:hypothetical protein
LESLAVGEAVTVFAGGGEVWETLGSADCWPSGGKRDQK